MELIHYHFYYILLVNTSYQSSPDLGNDVINSTSWWKGAAKNLRPLAIYSRVNLGTFTGKLRKRSPFSIRVAGPLGCKPGEAAGILPTEGKGLLERKGLPRLETEITDGVV